MIVSKTGAGRGERYLVVGLVVVLAGLVVATVLLGSVPPVDRDALTHHLFVPRLWLEHGGIHEIPDIPFSYYPMNLDLLYTVPLALGNDIVPKYIHYLFALLTALLLHRHIARRLGRVYGLLGAVFFLSVPVILKLSITVYVDLGVVFFTTAALLLLLRWAEEAFPWRWLVLAGLCCGLAAGTKYNGLIGIVVLTLLVPVLYQRGAGEAKQSNGRALLCGLVFALATLTAFSPWLVRNYTLTGNPIYPLHNGLLQKLNAPEKGEQATAEVSIGSTLQQVTRAGSNAFISRKILYNEPWWQTMLLPIRFFFEGRDDDPRYFDGKLNPFLLVLPVLAFVFRPTDRQRRVEQGVLLSFSLLLFFFTFFQEAMRIRYVVAIVPTLVILAMDGLRGLLDAVASRTGAGRPRTVAVLLVAVCVPGLMLAYNGRYLGEQFAVVNPLPYLRGEVSRDDYITTFRPEYPAIRFANATLPRDARVLCLFLGNRGYYMQFKPVFEQPSSGGMFARFLGNERPGHTILEEMRARGISHILLRTDLTSDWLQRLSARDRQRIAPLFANADQPLWSGNGHVLLAVEGKIED